MELRNPVVLAVRMALAVLENPAVLAALARQVVALRPVAIVSVITLRHRHPRAVAPLAVDPVEARLKPAVTGATVAWVAEEAVVLGPAAATAEVRRLAVGVVVVVVVVAAVAMAAVEDDGDKRNDRGKNNENKIHKYDVVENFSYYVCGLYFWVAWPQLACGHASQIRCCFAAKTKRIRHTATGGRRPYSGRGEF